MPTKTRAKTKQAAPSVTVTIGKFDTRLPTYRPLRIGKPINDYRALTLRDYQPSGGTPLRDATAQFIGALDDQRDDKTVTIGVLIDESGSMGGNESAVIAGVNEFVAGMRDVGAVDPDAAGTVLAVIVTDGCENSSREVDHATLQKLVSDREADGWTFIFLGANIDAWAQGMSLGFSGVASGQTVNYVSSPMGTTSALRSVTTDSAMYLSNVGAYKGMRANTSRRSISEDGSESLANTGGNVTNVNVYASTDALKKARKATGR